MTRITPDDSPSNALIAAYESGRIAEEISTRIAPYFRYAYLFPKEATEDKQLTYTKTVDYDEQMQKQMRGKSKRLPAAKGTSLRKLKAQTGEARGVKFHQSGIEFNIREKDLNDKKVDFWQAQASIIREIRSEIDLNVFDAVKEYCSEINDSDIKGDWTTNDLEDITADIIRVRSKSDYYDLDVFAVGKKPQLELAVKAGIQPMQWKFPTTGYTISNTIPLADCPVTYGGEYISDDELFAFSSANPGLKLWYLTFSNPKVVTAPNIDDLPAYAPIINTFTTKTDEPEPVIKTQYLWGVACEPIEEGQRMFHLEGLAPE